MILVMGEPMLLRAAGVVFGISFYEKNEIVRFAIQEITQNLIQRAAAAFGRGPDEYRLEEERFLEREEFDGMFREQAPRYSLLFRVERDCFALCVDPFSETGQLVSPKGPGS